MPYKLIIDRNFIDQMKHIEGIKKIFLDKAVKVDRTAKVMTIHNIGKVRILIIGHGDALVKHEMQKMLNNNLQ